MALTEHYYTKFEESNFYHVYNRSVDRKPMFKNQGNYEFFLNRYNKYLSPVVDTYTFCLLPTHFHLLIRVKEQLTSNNLETLDLTTLKLSNLKLEKTTHDIVSHQFRKFFQSYAMSFNKQHNRIGTLFQTPFKRSLVSKEQCLIRMVGYIHANPQSHRLIDDFRNWKWSSYNRLLNDKPSKLKKQEVIGWFGSKENYLQFHRNKAHTEVCGKYIFED